MSTTIHSAAADAAQLYITAARNVDLAFRRIREKSGLEGHSTSHAQAVSELDDALNELAKAEELFNASVSY